MKHMTDADVEAALEALESRQLTKKAVQTLQVLDVVRGRAEGWLMKLEPFRGADTSVRRSIQILNYITNAATQWRQQLRDDPDSVDDALDWIVTHTFELDALDYYKGDLLMWQAEYRPITGDDPQGREEALNGILFAGEQLEKLAA